MSVQFTAVPMDELDHKQEDSELELKGEHYGSKDQRHVRKDDGSETERSAYIEKEEHPSVQISTEEGGARKRRLWRRQGKKGACYFWRWVVVAVIAFAVAVGLSVLIVKLTTEPSAESGSTSTVRRGAVATDVAVCSEIAADILRKNGSAVDAAITAMLCVGAVHAQSSGIGGGGFMVVYLPNGSTAALEFRETAPAASTVDMFHSNATLSQKGGLAVAIPGELRGMELAHRQFGRLKWSDLFEPVIELCRQGFQLTNHTARALMFTYEKDLKNNERFREIYTTDDGQLKKAGDIMYRKRLADTLRTISMKGADAFYTGKIARNTVNEVTKSGGIITLSDLESYKAMMTDTINISFNNYTLYATQIPSGGWNLLFPLNILQNYNIDEHSDRNLTYHRLVEAFKHTFARRTELGDPLCSECDRDSLLELQTNLTSEEFALHISSLISDAETFNISYYDAQFFTPPDSGTSHLSVLDSDGMAVSVTTTVNTFFGSKLMTEDGILLNNEMDDFSSPNITNYFGLRPAEANFISPGKRPLSSMCPIVAVKNSPSQDGGDGGSDREYILAGGSGGTRIPTSTAQVLLKVLSLNESLSDAIEARRVHHQLFPNTVFTETDFPSEIIDYLESKGHIVEESSGFAVVQGIRVDKVGVVTAHSDSRKGGRAAVLD